MNNPVSTQSVQKTARYAGFLYLILAICGGFAEFAVRQAMVVPGDAAATVSNILANQTLFRLGVAAELIGQVVFVLVVLALFRLLNSVNRNQAVLMVALVLVSVTITCLNMLNQFAALLLLNGSGYLAVFDPAQVQALVLYSLEMHQAGYIIAQVFFGLWLLPLGYLVYKSGFMPRLIGILLIVAGVGYMVDVATFFLVPGFNLVISEFTFIGELALMLWLLVKGVYVEQWEQRSLQSVPA
jgi:hypothetical protein